MMTEIFSRGDKMDAFQVHPGQQIKLDEIDPEKTPGFDGSKDEGKEELERLTSELEVLQELFYSAQDRSMLIVLQGMDTSGKDGTIRHVFDGVNPQGVRVASFKAPTQQELSHDFLWRIHQHAPAKGEIVIFNRSHYEDVLIVRVHDIVPEKVWKKRFAHINHFERLLADEGTIILKFFLHINKDEQKERLLARLEEPDKRWKFNAEDIEARKLWDDYTHAYEDVLNYTSTEYAPWYVIPSNRKWYRNLVIASILVDTLKQLDPHPPKKPLTMKEVEEFQKALKKS